MDESAPIRAIVIGVSVLLAIATISGVLMYYNTAKQMASNVGRGQDFAANYEQSIQDILLTGSPNVTGNNSYITGADVKNLLNYFNEDENVNIKITGIKKVDKNENYIPSITNTSGITYNYANSKDEYKKAVSDIIDGQKFGINVTRENNLLKYIEINGI